MLATEKDFFGFDSSVDPYEDRRLDRIPPCLDIGAGGAKPAGG